MKAQPSPWRLGISCLREGCGGQLFLNEEGVYQCLQCSRVVKLEMPDVDYEADYHRRGWRNGRRGPFL